jgi:hypothetical protein
MVNTGGLRTVTATTGAAQECWMWKGSVQPAEAVSLLGPLRQPVLSPLPRKVPSAAAAVDDPRKPPSQLTDTASSWNPAVGVNTQFTVSETVSPGAGLVSAPGVRMSTPSRAVASPVAPVPSTACSRRVYTPSATTLPASSLPSQVTWL